MTDLEDDLGFKINKSYADKYDSWRRKEEFQKLKDKYGEDALDSSSSSEVEDDDAQEITPEFEKQFLKALASVKSQDPRLYDKDVKFFDDKEEEDTKAGPSGTKEEQVKKKKKKDKPMYLKDYERKIIVEKGGKYSDEEDEDGLDDDDDGRPSSPTYVEEQKQIKSSLQAALKQFDDQEETDEPFLKKKKKTKEEKEKEEEDYIQWFKGEKQELEVEGAVEEAKDVDGLRNYWSNPQLDDGEKFLRDYILDKAYKPHGDEDEFDNLSDEDLSEDDRMLDEQEDFERKYNFRYEEPDSGFVKSYPRNIVGSMRTKDTSRAQKRQEVKERKQKEKQKLHEELKKLKNLKKMEIMEQLEKLRKATGNTTVGFSEDNIKGEFDSAEHDEMMKKIFDDEYDVMNEDDSKPVFEDEDLEIENWDEWTGNETGNYDNNSYGNEENYNNSEAHCEDTDFIMDAEYDPELHKKEKERKKKNKNKNKNKKNKKDESPEESKMTNILSDLDGRRPRNKHTSEFAKALQNEKPVFDPGDKTFEDYFEEYYKLDYEDLIGDLPCRFKYRTVVANDFGLSAEEILGAEDKELNRWVSLRKTTQYRTTNEELSDLSSFKERGQMLQKKQHIFTSLYGEEDQSKNEEEDEDDEDLKTDSKTPPDGSSEEKEEPREPEMKSGKKEKKKRRKRDEQMNEKTDEQTDKQTDDQREDDILTMVEKRDRLEVGETSIDEGVIKQGGEVEEESKRSRKRRLVEELRNKKRRRVYRRKEISDGRLKAYGVRPKAYKYKMVQQRIKEKRRRGGKKVK
ncbi:protein KRI1 homolog isoform X2 [Apostichopus japonicus]|uniref:protein KRI1 homolog isoform X2 n=1 Tax=Stichopus japonicus TaxID=307972 RepID=UPI003AB17F79